MTTYGCTTKVCAEIGHVEGVDGRCLRCDGDIRLINPRIHRWKPDPRVATCNTCLMPIDDCFCEAGDRRRS